MKIIIMTFFLLASLNAMAAEYITCRSSADYHDGTFTNGEFQIQTYNSSSREWGHGNYYFVIEYNAEMPSFNLTITQNDLIVLNSPITLTSEISYQSVGLDYKLLCQLTSPRVSLLEP